MDYGMIVNFLLLEKPQVPQRNADRPEGDALAADHARIRHSNVRLVFPSIYVHGIK